MTQQIIDIGANANDGTGEPLRQAFQAVNDNFSNIWAAGPVDSQVVISNNVVSTNVTNLDLILAGNGIGNVTVASSLVPNIDSVYDLGNINAQFDSVWARYYHGNGVYLTGIERGGSGGNVYFRATPPLNPNIGDIWIDSDTGVQYLYFNDNTSNIWAEMEAYQSFGAGGASSGNGVPGGSNYQLQFNSNGDFGASANLVFDPAVNQLQLNGGFRINGTISTPSHANITMNVYGTWGGGNNYEWVFDNLGRLVMPTVSNPENATVLANSANLKMQNDGGNVIVDANENTWVFSVDGNLQLPPASVASTPDNTAFANYTQKSIRGAIETVAGNPVASYSTALNQTETIWTATNGYVTSARMTLRVQYGSGPVTGMEMCDVILAKEWGTNANVSYVVSNRIRTNNSLGYANVIVDLDPSDNLIVTVTNTSGGSEYYSYSVTEFNTTND